MTLSDLRKELISLAAEMCRWPPEGADSSVYIRRSEVNSQNCRWAVRMKKLLDAYSKGIK